MVNSRPWLKSSKQKQRGRCLYHLSTVYSLKITFPSSATWNHFYQMGPLNALIFHLHLPSELSLTSQDAYLTPPPLSQTLQTPSHSDSVNDSASFLWEKVKHSEKIISFSYNQTLQSISVQFSSVQWLSYVQLFVTPWTAAHQASLSINSQSLLKLKSIELVMPSNHFILCGPLLFLPSIFPSIRVFSNESVLPIKWPKY